MNNNYGGKIISKLYNPSETIMFSNWHILFIAGVVIFDGIELFKRKIKSYIANNDKTGPINI